MNMKSMMFAGLGLTVAMTATVIWMKDDVKHMRDVRLQQKAAECAKLAQQRQASATTSGNTGLTEGIQQYDSTGAPIAAPDAPGADCPTTSPTTGATTPGAVDPMTGQPVPQAQPLSTDPTLASAQYDPNAAAATSNQYAPDAGSTSGQYDPNVAGTSGQYDQGTLPAGAQPGGF